MSGILRRLRGALGNAVVWASSWFAAGLGLQAALFLGFDLPISFWPFVMGGALNLATMGFLTGGAFSLYLGVAARRRTLAELKPLRLAVIGGLIAGLVVPVSLFGMALGVGYITGMGVVLGGTGILSGLLGGITAYGTVKLAQRSLPEAGTDALGWLEESGR